MNQRKWHFSFGPWTKIGVILIFLSIFNIFITFFGKFWENKSKRVFLSDLFFIEGAVILGVGALVASGATVLKMERWQSLVASPSGHVEYLRQQRRKQFSSGIMLMIIGLVLICLSVVINVF